VVGSGLVGFFEKGDVMKWETPAFVEINMSAEIGGYQTDFDDDREPAGPRVPRADHAVQQDMPAPRR
jgi:hypothetical protein